MRRYRLVPKEVKAWEQDIGRFCDVCHEQIGDNHWEQTEITISAKIGDVYPEGDFRKEERLDLCPKHWEFAKTTLEQALDVTFRSWDVEDSEPGEQVK